VGGGAPDPCGRLPENVLCVSIPIWENGVFVLLVVASACKHLTSFEPTTGDSADRRPIPRSTSGDCDLLPAEPSQVSRRGSSGQIQPRR